MIGIDAPESQKRWKKEEGYYGKESKAYLTELLKDKKVRLETDIDSLDRYGRTLAYVYLEDDTFVNAVLLKEGYAVIMTVSPNVRYADLFYKLQVQARENNRGIVEEIKNMIKKSSFKNKENFSVYKLGILKT